MARYPVRLIPGLPGPRDPDLTIALPRRAQSAVALRAAAAPSAPPAPPDAERIRWINSDPPTSVTDAPVEIGVYQHVYGSTMYICGTPGVLRVRTGYGAQESALACPLSGYTFTVNACLCEALIIGWQEGPTYTATMDESALTGTTGLPEPVFTVRVLPGRVVVEARYGLLGQHGGDGLNVAGTATLSVSRDGSPIGSLTLNITDRGTYDPWS